MLHYDKFVLCSITLFDSLMLVPCRTKHVGILSVILKYKYLMSTFVHYIGLVSRMRLPVIHKINSIKINIHFMFH